MTHFSYDPARVLLQNLISSLGAAAQPIWIACNVLLLSLVALLALRTIGRDRMASATPFMLSVVALIVWARIPAVASSHFSNPDESFWLVAAAALLKNPRPWVAIDPTTSGPLVPLPLMLFETVLGDASWGTARVTAVACWIGTIALLYGAFRIRFGRANAAAALLPLIVAVAFMMDEWDYLSYNGEHVASLVLAGAFYADAVLVARLRNGDAGKAAVVPGLCLGVVLGLAPWAKLQMVPIAAMLGGFRVAAMAADRAGWGIAALVAGAIVPSGFAGALLALTGATTDFWQSYVVHNIYYASVGLSAMFGRTPTTFGEALVTLPKELFRRLGTTPFFVTVAATSFAALLVFIGRRHRPSPAVWLGLLIVIAAAFTTIQTRAVFGHYLLLLLVPCTFLLGALLYDIRDSAQGRIDADVPATPSESRVIVAVFLFPAVLLLAPPRPAFDPGLGLLEPTSEYRSAVATIQRLVTPGDRVAIWGWSAPIWIATGTLPGTRDVHSALQLLPGPQQEYFLGRYANDLRSNKPRLFIDAVTRNVNFTDRARFGHEAHTVIRSIVIADYFFLEEVDSIRIYMRKAGVKPDQSSTAGRAQ